MNHLYIYLFSLQQSVFVDVDPLFIYRHNLQKISSVHGPVVTIYTFNNTMLHRLVVSGLWITCMYYLPNPIYLTFNPL